MEKTNLSMITMYQDRMTGLVKCNVEDCMQSSIWDICFLGGFHVYENMADTIVLHECLKAIRELFRNEGSKVDISISARERLPSLDQKKKEHT